MSEKDINKMTLEELKAEHGKIKDNHTRKIEILTQIIKLDPNDFVAFNNRGISYDDSGRYQEAINDYDQAIALNPKGAMVFNNRGSAYAYLGKYQKAINDYDQAIVLNPKFSEAFNNRGVVYGNLRKYQKAMEDYDQAIVLNPKNAKAFNNRGNAYTNLGEYQKAIEDYNQAIVLDPQYAEAFYNRGVVYADLGEHQEAIEDYDQAIVLNPRYAEAFYNRGVAYRKLGKLGKLLGGKEDKAIEKEDKAIEDFKTAGALDPSILSEKIKKSNQEVQDFQRILEELGNKHQEEEDNWFKWSKWAIAITLSLIVLVIILIAYGAFKSSDTYIIYVFSSVVTLAIIRQYTNAKSLRIEASNRVAMAKMFERVKNENSAYQQEFLPKLTDAIVYSTTQTKNNTDGLIEKITNILEKLKK